MTLRDFGFAGLRDDVPAVTRLRVSNESERELHELVAIRLADDDDRPIDEVVRDVIALFAGGLPAAVVLAAPGGDRVAAVGDGTLTEPGRCVIVCSIPAGVDPQEFLDAAETATDHRTWVAVRHTWSTACSQSS